MGNTFGEFKKDLRRIDQRLASLEQDARQPRLAVETDVSADKKTCKRTESAATAVRAKHGDLEPRGSAVFWTPSTWSTHPLTSTISVVLCRFERGVVFL